MAGGKDILQNMLVEAELREDLLLLIVSWVEIFQLLQFKLVKVETRMKMDNLPILK